MVEIKVRVIDQVMIQEREKEIGKGDKKREQKTMNKEHNKEDINREGKKQDYLTRIRRSTRHVKLFCIIPNQFLQD